MNMSYCRFENTLHDLQDCLDALDNEGSIENYIENNDPSDIEKESIYELIRVAKELAERYGDEA